MRPARWHWVLPAYGLLAVVLTFPLVFEPTRLMMDAGAGEDAYIFLWNIAWMKEALFHLHTNPYVTDLIFYPDGTNLALHTFPLLDSFLGAVVSFVRPGMDGLVLGYSFVVFLSFVLSAFGTYLLVHRLTALRAAAFVAGVLFAFTCYRFSNIPRLHCLATGWFPWAAWALTGLLEERTVRWGVLTGLFAAATLYSSLEYFALLAFGLVLALAYHTARDARKVWNGEMLRPKLAGAAVLLVLSAPLVLALLSHGVTGSPDTAVQAEIFSADALDFLTPNPRHPLYGGWAEGIERRFHGGEAGFGMAVPFVGLLLALWAIWKGDRGRTWPWAALGLFFFLLSLGPVIHVAGHRTPLPSLYRGLVALTPWLGISRTPMRAVVPLELVVAVLAGFALAPMPVPSTRRVKTSWIILGLIVFETLSIPLRMTPVRVHPFYREIALSPTAGAVIELPPKDRSALLHQIVHGRKIPAVRRAYPRAPERSLAFWEGADFRAFLDTLFRPEKVEALTPSTLAIRTAAHRKMLASQGFAFVVIDKAELPERERAQAISILRKMDPARILEDETLAVFEF
jgi:hypothetical protein